MNTTKINDADQLAAEQVAAGYGEWPMSRPMSKTIRLPGIIYRPELQNPLKRCGYGLVTLVAWAVWIYLFLPALLVVSQLLGYTQFPFGLRAPLSPSADQTILTLIVYAFLVGIAGGLLVVWATYNQVRFRQRDRRNGPKQMKTGDLAESRHVDFDVLDRLQASQITWLDHDEQGEIIGARRRATTLQARSGWHPYEGNGVSSHYPASA